MKRLLYAVSVFCFVMQPVWGSAQDVQGSIDQGMKASQEGRYDQAIQAFDQALKLKPNDPAITTYKATVYYARGNNPQALQLAEQVIKASPNFGRAYYVRAMVLEKQEKYDLVVKDLEKAKSLGYGIDPDFIDMMKRKAAAQK